MRVLELFDSRDKKRRLSHIKNLVVLAASDGSFDKQEMELIFSIGVKAGISPDELNRIFARPNSVKFHPPQSFKDRIEQLHDMVLVMLVDGDIHENEMMFCKTIAVSLGFKHQVIEKIVGDIIDNIVRGIQIEEAMDQLLKYA